MKSALFLQSEVQNPYEIYNEMLETNSVYRDEINNISAVYSYDYCMSVLSNQAAVIPPINNTGLNEHALVIAGKLARFRNPPYHAVAKQTALAVFQSMKPVSLQDILDDLMQGRAHNNELDFVDVICKRLPILHILNGFGFAQADCEFITDRIGQLVKIMLPEKTEEQLKGINETSEEVYNAVERHIRNSAVLSSVIRTLVADTKHPEEEIFSLCVSNLTGLMTQSYDASRGLLSNSLLQFLNNRTSYQRTIGDRIQLGEFVVETLRYDPPVHNTRRIAQENMLLGNTEIAKGEKILIVLAAANRDEKQFENSNTFDTRRRNNRSHLSFGVGPHACMAGDFATKMTTETLFWLFNRYSNIRLLSTNIEYEPIGNGRLAKSIIISLNK